MQWRYRGLPFTMLEYQLLASPSLAMQSSGTSNIDSGYQHIFSDDVLDPGSCIKWSVTRPGLTNGICKVSSTQEECLIEAKQIVINRINYHWI